MEIDEVLTAPQSPWQNPYVERLIGSMRRECVDHVIVLNERSLHRLLRSYIDYHHLWRTHLSLGKDAPVSRRVEPAAPGEVMAMPHVGACTTATIVTRPDDRHGRSPPEDRARRAAAGGTSEGRQPLVEVHGVHVRDAHVAIVRRPHVRAIGHANRAYEVFRRLQGRGRRQRSARRHWFSLALRPGLQAEIAGFGKTAFGVFGPTIHEESRQAVSAKPERHYSFFTSSSSPSPRRAAFVSSTR